MLKENGNEWSQLAAAGSNPQRNQNYVEASKMAYIHILQKILPCETFAGESSRKSVYKTLYITQGKTKQFLTEASNPVLFFKKEKSNAPLNKC